MRALLGALAFALTFGMAAAQGRNEASLTQLPERQAFFKLVGPYVAPLEAMNRGSRA